MVKLKRHIPLILVCLFVIFFYTFVIRLYFAQDDFFHLRISQTDGNLREFLGLFSFHSFAERGGIYFYRPIFREGFFNLFYANFGLNPFPFRLFQLAIHLANTVLVYKLVKLLMDKKKISLFASLFFGLSAANVGVLSYLAGGIQATGMTMFLLLAMIYFLSQRRGLAFIFFILGLASHELAVAYPVVLAGMMLVKHKPVRQLWPYVLAVGVFLYLQVTIIGLPTSESQYGFSFSPARILNSYLWYFVWSLGIPEMLLDFVGPGLRLNPNLMNFWGSYFKIIFPLFGLLILMLLAGLKPYVKNRIFWFFLFLFTVGITPVVFLPLHRSTYYLAFSLVGIAGVTSMAFDHLYQKRKVLGYLIVGAFIGLNLITIRLSQKTFWAITRSKIAQELIIELKNTYPSLPKGATVYFLNDPEYPVINKDWGGSAKQAKVALSGSDALALLYKDEDIKVVYEGEGAIDAKAYVFPIVAKIRL